MCISLNGQHTNKWCLLQKGSSLSFKRSCFVGREKTEQLKRLTGGFSLSEWRSGGVEYRERGRKGNSMCLSISWDCLNRSRILNARYIFQRRAARPRTPFRSLEFLFFKKRVISLRSLRESVFFVYISLCSKRVTLARINCPHVSLSMDGQCVWWISGGARAETLHCARGEFSPLKMRTELEPHLWLTLTVSCLPVFSLGFVPVLGFAPSERTEIQLDGLSITGSFFRFATNYCHNPRRT